MAAEPKGFSTIGRRVSITDAGSFLALGPPAQRSR